MKTKKTATIIATIMFICLFLLQPPKTAIYEEDRARLYGPQLTAVFGEDSHISQGETVTGYFTDKDTDRSDPDKPYRYTRWNLEYTDAYGSPAVFTFDNFGGEMTGAVRGYLTDRVEAYYNENFFQPYLEPYVDKDSVMYCGFYSLFFDPKRPETGIMFDERIQYEKDTLKHVRLNEMRYDTVFAEYPVLISMYGCVRYKDLPEPERDDKVKFLEQKLREMTDAMIVFSGGCLNGSFGITFLGEDGPAEDIFFQVLNGENYTGNDFELDLHEHFFGPVD